VNQMDDPKKCNHENFFANVKVGRILDDKTETKVEAFTADVTVECADCKTPFQFIGLQPGLHPDKPTVSIDRLELRAPIQPNDGTIFGGARFVVKGKDAKNN